MFRARRVMRHRAKTAKRSADVSRQGQPAEEHDAGPAPASDPSEQLEDLDELRVQGVLTDEEFTAEKRRLLGT